MTESGWLACDDPLEMMNHLERESERQRDSWLRWPEWPQRIAGWFKGQARPSNRWAGPALDRRVYLSACGMRRLNCRLWGGTDGVPAAFLLEERFADRQVSLEALLADDPERRWWWPTPWHLLSNVIRCGGMEETWPPGHWPLYCQVIRDVFGNPFRPQRSALPSAWITPTVASVGRCIYDDHDFHCLPILADALEDAGCDDADVLAHLRSPGPHVRGCWAVDLVSGRG